METPETGEIVNSNNLKLHPRMKDFYKFFKYNGKVVDIFDYQSEYLSIFSREILTNIKEGKNGWKNQLPEGIAEMIMKNKMFGWKEKKRSIPKFLPIFVPRDLWFFTLLITLSTTPFSLIRKVVLCIPS